MRLAGVFVPSIAAGAVTAEALSSIVSSSKSLGSRTRKTRVSIIFLASALNEYWTVENVACTENSLRMRTQLAVSELSLIWAVAPACRKLGWASRLERPRATSKSVPNNGCLGTFDRAEAISCLSSGDGEQTFSMFTLTCGWFVG